jgi:hypothetical protein
VTPCTQFVPPPRSRRGQAGPSRHQEKIKLALVREAQRKKSALAAWWHVGTVRRATRAVAPMMNRLGPVAGAEAVDQRGRLLIAGYAVKRLSASLSPRDRRESGRVVPRGAHRARSALSASRRESTVTGRAAGVVWSQVPAARRELVSPAPKPVVSRAAEWRRLLDSGEVPTRAALARRFGVSRARVTQALRRHLPDETR